MHLDSCHPRFRGRCSNVGEGFDEVSSTLCILFGDQLDVDSPALRKLDAERDTVLMMEVEQESTRVPSHTQRTVLFLSAMRHFAEYLSDEGYRVRYVRLDDPKNTQSFEGEIERAIADVQPDRLVAVQPGEWRVRSILESCAEAADLPLEECDDGHFMTATASFESWAEGRKSLVMEYFYRQQRRDTGYLMEGSGKDAEPAGGQWNYDKDNRKSFKPDGPEEELPYPRHFEPDDITLEVIELVQERLPDLPGRLDDPSAFGWAVTREQALEALDDFIEHRLPTFGPYEDAMWTDTPFAYHSALSPLLNLKLLNPRECCEKAIEAYQSSDAPIQSVEAFVRQLIGWREFIRGVYWLEGPDYADRNGLDAHGELPNVYWTGETDMVCMRECVGQVLDHSYAHHIPRLMVMGNFALTSGVHPKAVSDWYLGMFADGVDWVTLPNAIGMVMHADARDDASKGETGVVGTKPYAASGQYIKRMSNFCDGCRYDPGKKHGDDACPMSVFFWDFLMQHEERLRENRRMGMMFKNLDRLSDETRVEIRVTARRLREELGITSEGD